MVQRKDKLRTRGRVRGAIGWRALGVYLFAVVVVGIAWPASAAAKSKCFPRVGKCIVVSVNGQSAVPLAKKDRKQLAPYAAVSGVDDVETWLPQPVHGAVEVSAAVARGGEEWFGSDPGWQASVVPLEDVSLEVSRSTEVESSVRIGGDAVKTESLELESNVLPPGAYLLRVTMRGSANWDRATVFFRVAASP